MNKNHAKLVMIGPLRLYGRTARDGFCEKSMFCAAAAGTNEGTIWERPKAMQWNQCLAMLLSGGVILCNPTIPSAAAKNTVPKLNTKPSCSSPARRLVTHVDTLDACLKNESEAHSLLMKTWHDYSVADRALCTGTVAKGGAASYVELHTCLDSLKHARAIRKELPKSLKGTAL